MPASRPLPTVIGPTENALRALLAETLSSTPITSYRAWVILNAVSNADPTTAARSWHGTVADALKIEPGDVLEVIGRLRAAGLVDDGEALTDTGAAVLAAARSAVAATTSRLVNGISEAEQETTREVLDRIRGSAEELLSGAAERRSAGPEPGVRGVGQ